jgi:hypothetical protein
MFLRATSTLTPHTLLPPARRTFLNCYTWWYIFLSSPTSSASGIMWRCQKPSGTLNPRFHFVIHFTNKLPDVELRLHHLSTSPTPKALLPRRLQPCLHTSARKVCYTQDFAVNILNMLSSFQRRTPSDYTEYRCGVRARRQTGLYRARCTVHGRKR